MEENIIEAGGRHELGVGALDLLEPETFCRRNQSVGPWGCLSFVAAQHQAPSHGMRLPASGQDSTSQQRNGGRLPTASPWQPGTVTGPPGHLEAPLWESES